MALKLGACTYSWLYDGPVEAALKNVAALGFKYVEIMATPPHVWPRALDGTGRRRLRDTIQSLGLELTSLNPTFLDLNLASNNPAVREESVAQIKEIIELAADLGAKITLASPGKRHPLLPAPFEMAWSWSRQAVAELAAHCERHGIILGLENTPYGFMESARDLWRMIDEVGSPALRLAFDVANVTTENPAVVIEELADVICLVHLSDTKGRWGHLPVGMGEVDFVAVAQSLQGIAYEGVSILELTYPACPVGGHANSARRLETLGWSR